MFRGFLFYSEDILLSDIHNILFRPHVGKFIANVRYGFRDNQYGFCDNVLKVYQKVFL